MTDARTKMPPGLDALVLRCLEKDPDDRFESMEELIGALVALGLYRLKEPVEETGTHRWSLRRGNTAEEKAPDISAEYDQPVSARSSSSRPQREQTTGRGRTVSGPAPREQASDLDVDRRSSREHGREAAKRRRKAKRRRLLLGAVALVLLLVMIIVLAKSCGGAGPAPDITGKTWEVATAAANKVGLKLVKKQEVPYLVDAVTVLGQNPLPGIKSTDGTIQVTVSRKPIQVQINSVNAFDPPPGDGVENDAKIKYLIDKKENTSWSTEKYVSPNFASKPGKTGVGLVFTLAEGATMLKITYTLTGWKGAVQKVTSDNTAIDVATLGDSQQVYWTEPLTTGRIWFTQGAPLPDSTKYGVIINEISFWK